MRDAPLIDLGLPNVATLLTAVAVPAAAVAACAEMATLVPRMRAAIAAKVDGKDGELMASLPGFSDGPGTIRYNGGPPREETAHVRMAAAAVDEPLTDALTRWRDAIGARWVYARMRAAGPLIVEAKPDHRGDDWDVSAPPGEITQRFLLLRALRLPPRAEPRRWGAEVVLEGANTKRETWRLAGATLGEALRHARLLALAHALSDARDAIATATLASLCRYAEAEDAMAALAAEPFPVPTP